nr:hypothetical protein [Bacteroidota bacterium]
QMQKSYKTGDLKAYEFNGRFTGATAARYFLGYDEVGLALDEMSLTGIGKDNRFGSQKTVRKQPVVSVIPDKLMFSLEKTINGNGYLTK